jgi:hypothetical protein
MVKLGRPPAALEARADAWLVLSTSVTVWRVHRTAGAHVVAWDRLRFWGPSSARFDPHEPPPSHQGAGVAYAALDVPTALAEVFQKTRVVNTKRGAPYLTAWFPARDLRLLDLSGLWPVRNGASHAINTGRHDLCRQWARAIHGRWEHADGLYYSSAMTGRPCASLWTAAKDSFPPSPSFSQAIASPSARWLLQLAADEIGYRLV